jgi:hypothetical protein
MTGRLPYLAVWIARRAFLRKGKISGAAAELFRRSEDAAKIGETAPIMFHVEALE